MVVIVQLYRRDYFDLIDTMIQRCRAGQVSWLRTLLVIVWRIHPSMLEFAHVCRPRNVDNRRLPGTLAMKVAKRMIAQFNRGQVLHFEICSKRTDLGDGRIGYVLDLAIGQSAQEKKDHNGHTRLGLDRRDEVLDYMIQHARQKEREAEALVSAIERSLP